MEDERGRMDRARKKPRKRLSKRTPFYVDDARRPSHVDVVAPLLP